jgi:trk system potassium uptake protein TrkH
MSLIEAALLVLPFVVALLYGEAGAWSFLWTILIAISVGLLLTVFCRPRNTLIYAKEGFIIASLSWIFFSVIGALPFVFSREIPFFVDAFFETVSGVTTTGASILTNVESLSHGMIFWRSFTHWVGGMGVLVFIMAILPNVSGRPIHILRAEAPGPIVGKITPRMKDTARTLYLIYIALTALQTILLLCGGMSLFESAVLSFGTAGTGGFSILGDGLASYSPYVQWVIAAFMLLFGVNFNLYYLMLLRRFRAAFKNAELWLYFGIVGVSAALITINIYPLYENFFESLRHSVFQVASIVTTTGYATADFNLWPALSKGIIFVLMFLGGCAGSTAGGLKMSRVLILARMVKRELRHMLHPRSVSTVKIDGKQLEETTLAGISVYFVLYTLCMGVVFLLICWEPFGLETNLTATISCFNNVGPGLGSVGPMGGYAGYSAFSKIVLSVTMLLGRLEIYPLLLIMLPAGWKKQ